MVIEYPSVTFQQELPHSMGGSPEGWSRDEGTSVIVEYVLPRVRSVYIQSPSYDGGVLWYHLGEIPAQVLVPTLHDSLLVPSQGVVPTLRDLSLLPVPNWYLLGLQLRVSADELDVIERNYPRDNHMCKVKMFGAWLRMDTSATYEKLARALVTVGKRNIAEALCTARGTRATTLECSCVTALSCGAG